MTITEQKKSELIQEHGRDAKDTGSPEVQIAIITERINALQGHFKSNHKDHASRRGLLMLVGRRNRLLRYLSRTDRDAYQALIKKLGLRK
ncbi:MAG: 30S ribosomal protein S15 [Planctomycetaceae bacterium]|jgi:small subunit ribosomal protein S15|nr:30S ribosomal protein S15 [Planctomycetaceae bacterium]|tara:strand:- start:230 stop:499 length:270 start_codon:yes stop_codon:yes gene_type:complete